MANQEHLAILKQGVKVWNQWRKEHADIQPDLSKADLSRIDLRTINLSNANLYNADLFEANLSEANLSNANCEATELSRVNFKAANLSGVRFYYASLRQANLSQSNLCGADLGEVAMAKANLTQANLTGCRIYGISAWDLRLEGTIQENLIITDESQPAITVDNIEVAQFVYLLLNNAKIRDVINTLTTKAVLILGRFTPRRKAVLDALREALRTHGYVPILFDFDRPSSRNVTETVKTLAHLSRFIIADLTNSSSIAYELAHIVPGLAVPVQPILLEGKKAFAMFSDLPMTYTWVLPTYFYADQSHLLATLQEYVIAPAEQKAQELEKR